MDKRHPKSKKPKNLLLGATIAITVATMLVVIAIVTFVIAANNQTVNSNLSVSYYANNVSATVTGSYQKSGDTNPTTMTSSGNNSINFYATEARTSRTFDSLTLTVDAQNPYVLFIYSFRNNATRDTANNIQGYDVRVSLANNAAITGFTTYYYTTSSTPTGTLTQKYNTVKTNGSTSLPSYQYAYAQRTIYYMMLVEITNLDFDASYADSELGGISWTLDHIGYKDGLDPSYDPNDYVINNDGVLTAYEGSSSNLVIPNTATSINMGLFQDDTTIESVSIPSSVTNVGESAFQGCINLESVTFESGSSPTSSTFKGIVNSNNQSLGDANTTTIGGAAFSGCVSLSTLILPNNLVGIPWDMCYGCSSLGSIEIPSSITYIDDCAFYECTDLTSITMPNSVTDIGVSAFDGCTSLYSLVLSSNLTTILERMCSNCSSLSSIIIPSGVESIGTGAFQNCVGLTSVSIPNNVTSIGLAAFGGCIGITSITIPNSVTYIGSYTFEDCVGLTSVIIGNCVESIGMWAFSGCTGLTSITIPNSVTFIGDRTFYDCTGLVSVMIGSGVTFIGQHAFSGCTNLTSVTLAATTGWWYSTSSTATSGTSITVTNTSNNATYLKSTYAYEYWKRTTPDNYFVWNGTTIVGLSQTGYNSGITDIVIPSTATAIGDIAFAYTYWTSTSSHQSTAMGSRLKSVVIGNSVTSIGYAAFWNCSALTSIPIPDSITSIGARAFESCSGLTSITIPNNVTSIGESAFSGCTSLTFAILNNSIISKNMFYHCVGLTSVTIGSGATTIKSYAFQQCSNLTSVTIGSGVTTIEMCAFVSCSSLTSFTFVSNPNNGGLYWYYYQTQITDYDPSSLASFVKSNNQHGYGYGTYGEQYYICCVTGDTLIAMADRSQKRIEEIVVGDEILSYNMETGEVEVDYVDHITIVQREIKVTITFTDGTSIKVTDDHPLLTTLGWKCWDPEHGEQSYSTIGVCDETFAIGDKLLTLKELEGMYLAEFDKTIASIDVEHYTNELYTMYTLRVSNNHNYFSAGVLSHNDSCVVKD